MAPVVLMSAAATAVLVSSFAKTVAGFAGGATTVGTVGWVAAGVRKVPCPACGERVRVWNFAEHARGHTYQCPSCQEHVPFSHLQIHAQRHGFLCPVCEHEVPLADLGTHVEMHSAQRKMTYTPRRRKYCLVLLTLHCSREDLRTQDLHYRSRLRELTREYERRMLKIPRAEAEFNEAKEQARLLWAHLKVNCYICDVPVCIAEIESHVAQHSLGLKPGSIRRDELAKMKGKGTRAKNSRALMKRWGGHQ